MSKSWTQEKAKGYMASSAGALVTMPAATKGEIVNITLVNTNTTPEIVTLYAIENGGSVAANRLVLLRTIPPGGVEPCYELLGKGIETAGTLQGSATTASKVTYDITYRAIVNG